MASPGDAPPAGAAGATGARGAGRGALGTGVVPVGTLTLPPQTWHVTVVPAVSSLTLNDLPHRHVTIMGMGRFPGG